MGIGKHFGCCLDRENKLNKDLELRKNSWHQCQCSSSSQIPSQDDLNYHQFLSLYSIRWNHGKGMIIIYDTETEKETEKSLDTDLILDYIRNFIQLPNGELFCYGNPDYGRTLIIDRNYNVKMLPTDTSCESSSVLYFNNNVYCFGGDFNYRKITLSRKFDLLKNKEVI